MSLSQFATGDLLHATDLNNVSRQGVITVTGTDERAQIASPHEGMLVYRTDANVYEMYTGSAWVEFRSSDTGWINLPLNATAVSFNSTSYICQYRRVGNEVRLRGLLRMSATGEWAGGTVYANQFTLPVGFRSDKNYFFAASTTTSVDNATILLNSNGNGDIRTGATGYPTQYVSLSNIAFWVD